MLYYLFDFLQQNYNFAGAGLFQYISFRAALAMILSLVSILIFGKKMIRLLKHKQAGEPIRDLGLQGQLQKQGTPTMGGIIIIMATLLPVLLLTQLHNIYIILLIISMLFMGGIGFADDYIKVFKKNKKGLQGKFKILGQVSLGIFIGLVFYFHKEVTVKMPLSENQVQQKSDILFSGEQKMLTTTIPFLKNNVWDYAKGLDFFEIGSKYAWLVFIPIVIFIITAVSNGANLTDGIDGLATGASSIIVITLGIFAWFSSHIVFADYFDVMYVPGSGEIVIFTAAFAGALIGFLWYNVYPAQVFMGDTGSLTIGAMIAVVAIFIRKELILPVLAGIFLVENLSVILQVTYFKYTKKKYSLGKRIFRMAPLHHHYQKKGIHESKIVIRFWIFGIVLAVLSIVTLKLR